MSTAAKPDSFWPIIYAVFFGNFLAILSTTTINVAFPLFIDNFHTSLNTVQWIMSGFVLATGVIAPAVGYLGDQLSYKRLYMIAMGGFTLSSALCISAWNIESLITFRVIQGLFSGMIMPTTMTIIYQVVQKDKQPFAMSLWSLSSMLAPAFGPTLGGWMVEYFGWRSIFVINLPIGVAAVIAIIKYIPYYRLSEKKSFDKIGLAAVTISSTALLMAFSQGSVWGWTSGKLLTVMLGGFAFLAFFIKWELTVSSPLLQLRLFKNVRFTLSLVINCVITISLYAVSILIPLFLQNVKHMSVLHTGLILLPGSLALAACSPITGKLYTKIGPLRLIASGIALIGIATLALTNMGLQTTAAYIILWLVIRYIGVALCNMPVTNLGMSSIPRENSGHGSAITNWVRQGIASLSIGIFSSLLVTRTNVHLQQLGQTGSAGDQELLREQASALGVNDVFMIGTIVAAAALPLVWLLRKPKPQTAAASAAQARN
ncbi:multidrug efflux MFS transporter [Paenibacillus doosanensis]|uniref:Multidrug export protein EmrB n=1 Tax=Paenibacillus konkukensis TaxID=2020716 RepID=A0ABY4RM48_9BACL|nr:MULTISPECIES: MDR family MFS transporter [Paenibacillus]MCS7462665.1 multidrug efflux MFS transporter [Paenibacillus doosanensis]UQZ82514.1 Multidrug export protein EmrB [Paenibacillus konkukensis]